jgi:hypothetical protein
MPTKLKQVAVHDSLIQEAAAACGTISVRDTCSVAVHRWLHVVVQDLRKAGLRNRPPAVRRGRRIDDKTWKLLLDATTAVPLGQVELLRCCLERTIDSST